MSLGVVKPQVLSFTEPLGLQSGASSADYKLVIDKSLTVQPVDTMYTVYIILFIVGVIGVFGSYVNVNGKLTFNAEALTTRLATVTVVEVDGTKMVIVSRATQSFASVMVTM